MRGCKQCLRGGLERLGRDQHQHYARRAQEEEYSNARGQEQFSSTGAGGRASGALDQHAGRSVGGLTGAPGPKGDIGDTGPAGPASMVIGGATSGEHHPQDSEKQGFLDDNKTTYVSMFFSDAAIQRDAVEQRMPLTGTLTDLYITLDGSPGAGTSYTLTILNDGVATNVSCIVSGTSTQCTDLINSAAFTAGDGITIESVPSNGPVERQLRWTAVYGQ